MAKFFTLFFIGAFISLAAQSTTYSLQLFYDINETFNGRNMQRLDSFFAALPAGPVQISIRGYADFLYSDNYNLGLSQKRADLVKKTGAADIGSQAIYHPQLQRPGRISFCG